MNKIAHYLKQSNQIAQTIIKQLGGAGRLKAMLGVTQFIGHSNGVSFRFKGSRIANHIKITLNSKDLYDIELTKIHGMNAKKVATANDMYFDQMKPWIEKQTKLYLSL